MAGGLMRDELTSRGWRVCWLLVVVYFSLAAGNASNPISRVVELLWEITNTVKNEGEKEQQLFEKYQCFCNSGKSNLQQNIADESMKSPQVQGDLGKANGYLARLGEEIRTAKQERDSVSTKMAQAHSMRKKDQEAFLGSSAEIQADISALDKAIKALEKGTGPSFLQTDEAAVLHNLVDSDKVSEDSRQALMSLLGTSEDSDEASAQPSSEVIGICKQLMSSFQENSAKAAKQEQEDVQEYRMLQSSSEKEAKALSSAIKTKLERVAELKAKIVDIDDDVESTGESLQRDKLFVDQMQTTCATLEHTYSEHKRMRGEELVTLSETIKLLGDDDAKALFADKDADATGGASAASFLQVKIHARGSSKSRKQEAIRLLKAAKAADKSNPTEVNLLLLALRGKQAKFDNIIKMIDGMVVTLRKEDQTDDQKKQSCMKDLDETDDSLKEAGHEIKSSSKVITDQKETLKTLEAELVNLVGKIKQIDEAMEQSTVDRKANNNEFVELLSKNRKAIAIIESARKRLLSFYNPQVASYNEPEKVGTHSEKDTNPNLFGPGAMGMMRGMTGLDQEDAEVQQSQEDIQEVDDAEAGAPGKLDKYLKSNKASANALELLMKIKSQIERDTSEAQQEEKNHKASYQMMLGNANDKRSRMVKTTMQKESVKAKLEQSIHKLRGKKKQSEAMQKDLSNYNVQLQQECSWLLQHIVARHHERRRQTDALNQARTILNGATGATR